MFELFGHKSTAILDLWSITHFLSGAGVVLLVRWIMRFPGASGQSPLLICLMLSAGWEFVEIYMELGLIGGPAVARWFDGVEHWSNRIIADQALFVLGFALASGRAWMVLPAKALSLGWLGVHVFVLPHSMYIQESWGY